MYVSLCLISNLVISTGIAQISTAKENIFGTINNCLQAVGILDRKNSVKINKYLVIVYFY